MIYLLTLLTLLSLGILIALFLKNMELKEQINKGLEENAENRFLRWCWQLLWVYWGHLTAI